MKIVAYISGHGLGHSAREVEILRHLPEEVSLVIKTAAPEWFWRDELKRPFEFLAESYDVGCVQKDGLHIDAAATLSAWHEMEQRNQARFAAEVEELRRRQADLVLTDIASFPLTVARESGIPAVCIVNFTWVEIYRGLAETVPELAGVAERLAGEYARASLALETGFSLPMPYFERLEPVGLVARPGTERRQELLALLPTEAREKRLALVYVGGWGLPIPYSRVEEYTDWHFLSLDPPPSPPANWTTLPRRSLDHPDLVASVDLVISKPGYGLAAECVSLGTPLLYPPRPEFAEYAALHAVLSDWPGGIPISRSDFLGVNWRDSLKRAVSLPPPPRLPAPGGPAAAAYLSGVR